MKKIVIKRVYDPFDEKDGYRVLVDRLWPRGIKKETLHCNFWAKEIAPSSELRSWFHQDMENRWEKFAEMYKKELVDSSKMDDFAEQIRPYNTITLLYASKDTVHNHALILKSYLEGLIN